MKNLFSERYGYKKLKQLRPNEMPDSLRKRIWNFLQKSINEGEFMVQKRYEIKMDRNRVIEIIWDKFFKEDLNELKKYWIEEYI
jgi:hypothetical protein